MSSKRIEYSIHERERIRSLRNSGKKAQVKGGEMKFETLVVRPKKIFVALFFIALGIAMIFYGAVTAYIDNTRFEKELTDAEIIQRAKDLGMVDLKEYLNQDKK